MGDLEQQCERLAEADRHVAAGERLLASLVAHIDEMSGRGEDTAALDRMLRLFQDTLEQWQAHQQAILEAISHVAGS